MNRSVVDAGGPVLVVSQFTLLGDVRRGPPAGVRRRRAARRRAGRCTTPLVGGSGATGLPVATGVFQADMAVELVNDGPVTILLDSRRVF